MTPSIAPDQPPPSLGSAVMRVYGDFRFHTDGDILALAFLPDGTLRSVEEPGLLRRWRADSGQLLDWHSLSDWETLWVFSPNGQLLASASDEVSLWNATTGDLLAVLPQPAWVTSLALGARAGVLVTGHDDGTVRLWHAGVGSAPLNLLGPQRPISAVALSHDGSRLAAACEDKNIYLWDTGSGKPLGLLTGHTDRIQALAWHPQGRRLVSAAWDTTARVWDVESLAPVILLNSHAAQVQALAFSPDGERLVCADSADTLHVWGFSSGKELTVLSGHADAVHCLAISTDGKRLASGGADKVIRIWDLQSGQRGTTLPHWPRMADLGGHRQSWTSLAVSNDGRRLASTGSGSAFQVWDTDSNQSVPFEPANGVLQSVAQSPDRKHVAAGGVDGKIRLWDDVGRLLSVLDDENLTDPVTSLVFSPDSTRLASGSATGTSVWIWQIPSGEPCLLIPDALDGCTVEALAFHPKGILLGVCGIDWLATGGSDGAIALWDLDQRCEVAYFGYGATCLAFSPDGRWLAAGSLDRTICIVDTVARQLVAELTGPEDTPTCVAFSPDGRWLVCGGDDRTLRFWSTDDWRERATADLDTQIKTLVFSPDGKFIYTGNGNTTCYQLDVRKALASGT